MITEQNLKDLEECDEYSLRHYSSEVQDLVQEFRELKARAASPELVQVVERMQYEANENPAPVGDGGLSDDGWRNLAAQALDAGLLDLVRAAK